MRKWLSVIALLDECEKSNFGGRPILDWINLCPVKNENSMSAWCLIRLQHGFAFVTATADVAAAAVVVTATVAAVIVASFEFVCTPVTAAVIGVSVAAAVNCYYKFLLLPIPTPEIFINIITLLFAKKSQIHRCLMYSLKIGILIKKILRKSRGWKSEMKKISTKDTFLVSFFIFLSIN